MSPFTVASNLFKAANHLAIATSNVCESVEVASEVVLTSTRLIGKISEASLTGYLAEIESETLARA